MSFDLNRSIALARQRLAAPAQLATRSRALRADAGRSRMPAEVVALLEHALSGYDRPQMRELRAALDETCQRLGVRSPSRAAIYVWLARGPAPSYRLADLPEHIGALVHNLDADASIPGPQLVVAIMNQGDARALSFAAGMPLVCLERAERSRDLRPKSHALLQALLRART